MEYKREFPAVWCYSIYGSDYSKYYEPMLTNIELASSNGVALVIHTNKESEDCVRAYFNEKLNQINIIVHNNKISKYFPKILRFLTCKNIDSEFYFFKDSDSIVSDKEILIMNEWMAAKNYDALIMRDHPLHISPILAGMFGVNRNLSKFIADSAEEFFVDKVSSDYSKYSYDQDWLASNVYPLIVGKAVVNTSFFFYSHEHVTRIRRDIDNHEYIGAQFYKRSLNKQENIDGYLRIYGADLLSLPYYPKLDFLYGRVRPTLAAAYLFCNLFKKYSKVKNKLIFFQRHIIIKLKKLF